MYRKDINGAKYRRKCLRQKLQCCAVCGYSKYLFRLTVHHVDGNRDNNDLDNLLPVCRSCHTKVHNTPEYIAIPENELPDDWGDQWLNGDLEDDPYA